MPTIPLHKTSLSGINTTTTTDANANDPDPSSSSEPILNPLPQFLHTPSGLAILELQGKINLPAVPTNDNDDNNNNNETNNDAPPSSKEVPIGRLVFPDYSPKNDNDASDTKWMKRVYLYVGHHQRMVGEVKKLERPLGVIQRRKGKGKTEGMDMDMDMERDADGGHEGEELEIVEVVRHRVIFSDRPEPVGREEARYG